MSSTTKNLEKLTTWQPWNSK